MKGKNLRTFTVNEKEMIFNVRYFQEMFIKFASKKQIGIGNYEYEVADALFVDKSTIHNWRMNVNGPGDIEKIQLLATFWHIKYESLLMEVETMKTVETINGKYLTEIEKNALRNVYREFLAYLEEFKASDGFRYDDDGNQYNIFKRYALYDNLKLAVKNEYIDLKRTMYKELEEFVAGEVSMTLEEYEMSYSEPVEQIAADVEAMYERMMDSFKKIVDEYLV